MIYKNGKIFDGNVSVTIPASVTTILATIDSNYGIYNYINLTTGEKQLSGITDGLPNPIIIDPQFVGLDVSIAADTDYISALQNAQNIELAKQTQDITNLIIAIENGTVNASNGVSRPAGDAILWAKSPIPASFAPGMYIDVSLPTQTSNPAVIVSVDYKLIGPNNEELTPQSGGITVSRLPNTNTLRFQSSTTTWQNGGYIAVTYKE